MSPYESVLREMPDIANDAKAEVAGALAWVGMNEIEMPVRIEDDAGGLIQSTALVTAYVNHLKGGDRAPSSVKRSLVAVRGLHGFLAAETEGVADPTVNVPAATRANTPARRNSLALIAVRPNPRPL